MRAQAGEVATVQCGGVVFEAIEAIVFDKDGTLADSLNFLRRLGQRRARWLDAQIPGTADSLLMAYGIDGDRLDPGSLLAIGSRQDNLIAAAAYVAETGRSWSESLRVATEAFDEADRWAIESGADGTTPLLPGVRELLAHLRDRGLTLGILSADTTAGVEKFVRDHGLAPYLALEMGVDGRPSKPDPALFLDACQRLGVEPARTLMVGDSPLDIQLAQAAGAAGAIGVDWSAATTHLAQADVTIARLDEITVLDEANR